MDTDFALWLIAEMDRRGWTNSELSRRAGIVPSTLSKVISGQNSPGLDFCLGVARAFGYPPERVLRESGLLPTALADERLFQQFMDVARNLSQAELENALEYLLWRYQQQAGKQEPGKHRNEEDR